MKKVVVMVFFTAPFFWAASASAITISAAIPGLTNVTTSSPPGAMVVGLYNFALMIGGVLAFGAVVYGGILYAISAGNSGKQSEGKEWIKSALFGLMLLAGAYLVLYTINPNLVSLGLPTLETITIPNPQGTPAPGQGGIGTDQSLCSNIVCPPGSTPSNMQTFTGGQADCICGDSGSHVYCGGNSNGNCPSDTSGNPQTCTQIQTYPTLWGCQSTASFTCGNATMGAFGSCPSGQACNPRAWNGSGTPIGWSCSP